MNNQQESQLPWQQQSNQQQWQPHTDPPSFTSPQPWPPQQPGQPPTWYPPDQGWTPPSPPYGQPPYNQGRMPPTQYPPYQQPGYYPQQQQPYYQPPYYPPPMMHPPPKRRNGCLIAIAVLVALFIFGSIVNAIGGQQSSTSTTQATDTPTPTDTPVPTPNLSTPHGIEQYTLQLAQNSSASGTDMSSHYDAGSKGVVITETIGEQFDNNSTKITIQNDCFQIQQAIWKSSVSVKTVEVHIISNNLVDQYGNTSSGPVGICTLDAGTAQKFNWDNLTYDQAWSDFDSTWMLPSLNQ